MKELFIIAGCNGAGKTTASYSTLPTLLNCKEFINADEIAKGIFPFQLENAGITAGRLMLNRIKYLLNMDVSFAIETTLATKSYCKLIDIAKKMDLKLIYYFFG